MLKRPLGSAQELTKAAPVSAAVVVRYFPFGSPASSLARLASASSLLALSSYSSASLTKMRLKSGSVFSLTASGSTLTFESGLGFPTDSRCASLAHANRHLHHPQAC